MCNTSPVYKPFALRASIRGLNNRHTIANMSLQAHFVLHNARGPEFPLKSCSRSLVFMFLLVGRLVKKRCNSLDCKLIDQSQFVHVILAIEEEGHQREAFWKAA